MRSLHPYDFFMPYATQGFKRAEADTNFLSRAVMCRSLVVPKEPMPTGRLLLTSNVHVP